MAGLRAADPRPATLVSSSAVGYYGTRGDEELDEDSTPGTGFLADVCVAWEREAYAAGELGLRVVTTAHRRRARQERRGAGQDAAAFQPRRRRPRGRRRSSTCPGSTPTTSSGSYLAALDDARLRRAGERRPPSRSRNKDFSKALGRALHRPAFAPVPGLRVRLLYGEMAEIVTEGQRALPRRARELGYAFRHPELDEALRSALG